MNYRVKGYAANPLVIGGVCLVIGIAVGIGGTLYYMHTHQGGAGGDTAMPLPEASAVSDVTLPAETESGTEPPSTEPVTENLSYIQVTVSGNDYIYKGETFTLEQFIGIVRVNPDLPVHIREDGASMRAYSRLIGELQSLGAEYAESGELY